MLGHWVPAAMKDQLKHHLFRDLVERVDVSSATEQSLEQNDGEDDPDTGDKVKMNL